MVEKILGIVRSEARNAADLATPLDELGLDSLETTELILLIEKETGIDLEPQRLAAVRTVGDLVDAFVRQALA